MNKNELYHHGIIGQKWGVRRYQNEDGSLTPKGQQNASKNHNTAKIVGAAAAGIAVGAVAVGTAWYLKNRSNKKIAFERKKSIQAKRAATIAARKASGYYNTFKNVDVVVKGNDFIKSFSNVKVAKILK